MADHTYSPKPDDRSDNAEKQLQDMAKNKRREQAIEGMQQEIKDENHEQS